MGAMTMRVLTAMLLMAAATPVMAEELKITCVEIESVTGQPFFECAQPDGSVKQAQTIEPTLVQIPPRVPNEETKKRALMRAYELNGNKMCCGFIDVSQDPVVTGRNVITPETEFNVLDATTIPAEKRRRK
jgi:hypothetical protein